MQERLQQTPVRITTALNLKRGIIAMSPSLGKVLTLSNFVFDHTDDEQTYQMFSMWELEKLTLVEKSESKMWGLKIVDGNCAAAFLGPRSCLVAFTDCVLGEVSVADTGPTKRAPVTVAPARSCSPIDVVATETTIFVLCCFKGDKRRVVDVYESKSAVWVRTRTIKCCWSEARLKTVSADGAFLVVHNEGAPGLLRAVRASDGLGDHLVCSLTHINDLNKRHVGAAMLLTGFDVLVASFDTICLFTKANTCDITQRTGCEGAGLGLGFPKAMSVICGVGLLVCGNKGVLLFQTPCERAMSNMTDARVWWMSAVIRGTFTTTAAALSPSFDQTCHPKRRC